MILENLFYIDNNGGLDIKPVVGMYSKVKQLKKKLEFSNYLENLQYLYFILNKKELFNGYRDKEFHNIIRNKIGLDESWIPHNLTEDLIKELEEDLKTPEERLLDVYENTLYDSIDFLKQLTINNRNASSFLAIPIDILNADQIRIRQEVLNQSNDGFLKLLELNNKMSLMIDNIKTLRHKVTEDRKNKKEKTYDRLQMDKSLYERII